MGLFGDELLLNAELIRNNDTNPIFQINKYKNNPDYILPFSCISLLLSQLTVLSEGRPDYLSRLILEFINNPRNEYLPGGGDYLSSFELTLKKSNSNYIYNEFKPQIINFFSNSMIEREVAISIYNYIIWVFWMHTSIDKENFISYLLQSVYLYNKELRTQCQRSGIMDLDSRQRVAIKHIEMSSSIYNEWKRPPTLRGTLKFEDRIKEIESILKR